MDPKGTLSSTVHIARHYRDTQTQQLGSFYIALKQAMARRASRHPGFIAVWGDVLSTGTAYSGMIARPVTQDTCSVPGIFRTTLYRYVKVTEAPE